MWFAAAMAGSSLLSSALGYSADKEQAEAAQKMQQYRNKMTNIANAINQNSITTNTTLAIQQSAKKAVYMRRDELSTLGSTAVAAAAAGVRGNSVNASIMNAKRNASLIEKQRSDDLEQTFTQMDQQRLSSTLSAVQNQDLSYIPTPSLGAAMLNAGTQAASTYMSYK